jgi:hypothetical protein
MNISEHFFMCFWPFGFLPLKKFCLVQLPTSLLVQCFGGILVFEFTVYSGYQSFGVQLAKIFSHSVGGLFNLATISFIVQKVFNFM